MAPPNEAGILIAQGPRGKAPAQCFLRPDKANRHGLITGATGTGKTITLQTLAEGFSRLGVPVFMADVKGDLSGIAQAGQGAASWPKSWPSAAWTRQRPPAFPPPCGMCLANKATRCAPRSAT